MTERNLPEIVSREQWLTARRDLLAGEKESVRAKDALNTHRRQLPMVRIEKDHRFTGPDGTVGLGALFDGERQLVVRHFMFDPSWDKGCSSRTAGVDELSDGRPGVDPRHDRARPAGGVGGAGGPLRRVPRGGPRLQLRPATSS